MPAGCRHSWSTYHQGGSFQPLVAFENVRCVGNHPGCHRPEALRPAAGRYSPAPEWQYGESSWRLSSRHGGIGSVQLGQLAADGRSPGVPTPRSKLSITCAICSQKAPDYGRRAIAHEVSRIFVPAVANLSLTRVPAELVTAGASLVWVVIDPGCHTSWQILPFCIRSCTPRALSSPRFK